MMTSRIGFENFTRAASVVAMATLTLAAAPELSAEPACPFNYAKFEFIIPHVDVETCPDKSVKAGTFCRATTGGDQVHIFYFDGEGDQCLLKIDSIDEDGFALKFK